MLSPGECYSPAHFLLLNFSIFACGSLLVPLGFLLFEQGELSWIRKRFLWVNALLQARHKPSEILVFVFPQPMGLGATGLFAGQRLSFCTSQRDTFLQKARPGKLPLPPPINFLARVRKGWEQGRREGRRKRKRRRRGRGREHASATVGSLGWKGHPRGR